MTQYPDLLLPSLTGGEPRLARPTGSYRVEFGEPIRLADAQKITGGEGPDPDAMALAVTTDRPTDSIEDIRALAAEHDVIKRVLPIYDADGHRFSPLPGTLLVRGGNEPDPQPGKLLWSVLESAADELGIALQEIKVVEEGIPFDGLYQYGVLHESKEPSLEIFAFASEPAVCMDAEHPDSLAIDPEEIVNQTPYDGDYIDAKAVVEVPLQPDTVAILDSYFDLRHGALNFRDKKGISTLDFKISSIDKHGTSCAGVIGANPPPAHAKARGEIPGGELIAIRVFERGLKAFAEVALANGIATAVKMGAGVISVSLGTPVTTSCALGKAVEEAIAKNVVIVAGSGNAIDGEIDGVKRNDAETPVAFPAAFKDVIAVGAAIDKPPPARCVREKALGGGEVRWSSRYSDSGFKLGLDVVAQGLAVSTTDLKDHKTNTDNYWDSFLGTSAAAPIVAGLAARIRRENPKWTPRRVRAEIQCLAQLDEKALKKEVESIGPQSYDHELGFGFIERHLDDIRCSDEASLDPANTPRAAGPDDDPQTTEEPMAPTDHLRDRVIGNGCKDVECDTIVRKGSYPDVSDCARPLSIFLRALADRKCCELLYDFMDNPYVTARACGVPYSASVWLGSKNWDALNEALLAENNLSEQNVAQIAAVLGPIWVKAL